MYIRKSVIQKELKLKMHFHTLNIMIMMLQNNILLHPPPPEKLSTEHNDKNSTSVYCLLDVQFICKCKKKNYNSCQGFTIVDCIF